MGHKGIYYLFPIEKIVWANKKGDMDTILSILIQIIFERRVQLDMFFKSYLKNITSLKLPSCVDPYFSNCVHHNF
jgi:hypothetical protein